MRVLHVITGLQVGGAETMLSKLLAAPGTEAIVSRVVTLGPDGPIGAKIRALSIDVENLDLNVVRPNPIALWRLRRIIREFRPDVIQTWLYHSDLVGGVVARAMGRPAIWNIRETRMDPATSRLHSRMTFRLCAATSGFLPAAIVSCSSAAMKEHIADGYASDKWRVIPNGFDTAIFAPDATASQEVRHELRLLPDDFVAGHVARDDPRKDHTTLLTAFRQVVDEFPSARLLLIGHGMDAANVAISARIGELQLTRNVLMLGRRADTHRLHAACNIYVSSSSHGEGFPNVLGEAMSCGVPCVTTDVGDSSYIVGRTGRVVRPRDPQALSEAVQELARDAELRAALGRDARARIQELFDIRDVAANYVDLWTTVAGDVRS